MSCPKFVFYIDGKLLTLPVQIWHKGKGSWVLRIGENTLHFNDRGVFDGPEYHVGKDPESPIVNELIGLLQESSKVMGQLPDEPYYEEGSEGHAAEVGLPRGVKIH